MGVSKFEVCFGGPELLGTRAGFGPRAVGWGHLITGVSDYVIASGNEVPENLVVSCIEFYVDSDFDFKKIFFTQISEIIYLL